MGSDAVWAMSELSWVWTPSWWPRNAWRNGTPPTLEVGAERSLRGGSTSQGTHQALDDLEQLLHDHRDALVAEQPADDLEVRRPHEVPEAAINAGVGQVQGLGTEDTVLSGTFRVLDVVPTHTQRWRVTAQTHSTHGPGGVHRLIRPPYWYLCLPPEDVKSKVAKTNK